MEGTRLLLAYIDESGSYETDLTEIVYAKSTKEYLLRTASGCSCWDGEWNETGYKTLAELEAGLILQDCNYNPSLKGAIALVEEARDRARELNLPRIGRRDPKVALLIKNFKKEKQCDT